MDDWDNCMCCLWCIRVAANMVDINNIYGWLILFTKKLTAIAAECIPPNYVITWLID
jgi:hypothetical protein